MFLSNEGRGNPGHRKIRLYGKESEETREDKNKLSQIRRMSSYMVDRRTTQIINLAGKSKASNSHW